MVAAVAARKQVAAWDLDYPKYLAASGSFGLFSRGTDVLVATTNVGSNGGDVSQSVSLDGLVGDGTQYCDALGSNTCVTVNGGHVQVTLHGGEPLLLVKKTQQ